VPVLILIRPATSSLNAGVVVPIPTFWACTFSKMVAQSRRAILAISFLFIKKFVMIFRIGETTNQKYKFVLKKRDYISHDDGTNEINWQLAIGNWQLKHDRPK